MTDFALDKFEVTAGRFRAFMDAYGSGWRPAAGQGANRTVESAQGLTAGATGWQTAWDTELPVDRDALERLLIAHSSLASWTDSPADAETYPINGASRFEAFAFCIWDGGRLVGVGTRLVQLR